MQTRDAARVVLLDPKQRVLLIKIAGGDLSDPNKPLRKPFWITPGGRIEDGEAPETAVERELREETGLSKFSVGPAIWYGEHELLWKGAPTLLRERFFIARTSESAVSIDGMVGEERDTYRAHRWWSLDELRSTAEVFIPRALPALVAELLCEGERGLKTIDLSTPD